MPIPLPTLDPLESITIATPCTVPWSAMRGDERSRFCDQCQRQVFDLSAMTTAEVVTLLADPGGRPCVRLYRRPDGRVLTSDCPAGARVRVWRGLRRRVAWAASLFAMMLVPACRSTMGYVLPTPPNAETADPAGEHGRATASETGPAKVEESESIRTAHRELERKTGLPERQQYDRYRCEVWFYGSLGDRSNFGTLTETDRKDLKTVVGDGPFFLHRFTPKTAGGRVYEVFVSRDGTTVLGGRTKPTEEQGNGHQD